MKKRVVAAVLLVILLGLCCACTAQTPPDYLAFREDSFEAEICGARDGEAFSAKIAVTPTEEGATVQVEYLTPDALCGISVTATCRTDGTPQGTAEIRRGETAVSRDAADFYGLLEPTLCLFSLDAHTAVQKEGELYVLQFFGDVTVVLDGKGDPKSYSSPDLSYDVIWLEKGSEEEKG